MTSIPDVVTGDIVSIAADVQVNNKNVAIDPTTEIKAALVSQDHDVMYTDAVIQSPNTDGASWPNGVVVIEMSAALTAPITYQGPAFIELQVNQLNRPRTWFIPVKIRKGNIT